MRRRGDDQHDVLTRRDPPVAVNDGDAHERPARLGLFDMARDLSLGHAWIMLERQRRDRLAGFGAAANPGECDQRADVGAAARQRGRFRRRIELFALQPDCRLHSSTRHRREEGDLAGAGDRGVGAHMALVDGGADRLRMLERMGIFLAAGAEPAHQLRDRRSPKAAARSLPRPCRPVPAPRRNRRASSVDHMPHAGAHVVPARIERDQGGQPKQRQTDVGDDQSIMLEELGGDLVARVAGDQEADRDELPGGFPFRQPRHRNADPQLGQVFAKPRHQNFAAENDDGGKQRPAADGLLGGQHQQAGRDQELVGNRVEHPPERRLLPVHAGEIAVEHVGDPGRDEDRERHPANPEPAVENALPIQQRNHDRHRGDPGVGQEVGQRQRPRGQRWVGDGVHWRQTIRLRRWPEQTLALMREFPSAGCAKRVERA